MVQRQMSALLSCRPGDMTNFLILFAVALSTPLKYGYFLAYFPGIPRNQIVEDWTMLKKVTSVASLNLSVAQIFHRTCRSFESPKFGASQLFYFATLAASFLASWTLLETSSPFFSICTCLFAFSRGWQAASTRSSQDPTHVGVHSVLCCLYSVHSCRVFSV